MTNHMLNIHQYHYMIVLFKYFKCGFMLPYTLCSHRCIRINEVLIIKITPLRESMIGLTTLCVSVKKQTKKIRQLSISVVAKLGLLSYSNSNLAWPDCIFVRVLIASNKALHKNQSGQAKTNQLYTKSSFF